MARKRKVVVGWLNVRLHPHSPDLYAEFITDIFRLRVLGQVHGDRHGIISTLDRTYLSSGFISGVITTFLKIDTSGAWFNSEELDVATEEEVSSVAIPQYLHPNIAAFRFEFDINKHRLAFQNYAEGRWLTPTSAQKFFSALSRNAEITQKYGSAKITVVQKKIALDKLFAIPKMSEIKITILKPNADILRDDFDEQVEAHLEESHSRSITLTYQAEHGDSLVATNDIKMAGESALDNGRVDVTGRDETGVIRRSTDAYPYTQQIKYNPDTTSERQAFFALLRGLPPVQGG